MSGLNCRQVLRPASLAWYMAMSALLDRVSKSLPSVGNTEMPIDSVTTTSCAPSVMLRLCCCTSLLATAAASSLPQPGSTSTNSSPPWRESVSPARTSDSSRRAT